MQKSVIIRACFVVSALLMSTGLTSQDTCEIENKLVALDAQSNEFLGASNGVDISGNFAIVGGFGNDDTGTFAGAAHIYQKQGSEWVEVKKIKATDGSSNDRFGSSVAIWGDYAIVGAPFDDINGPFSGSAYIFHRVGQYWIQEFKISPSDGSPADRFGWDVDIWEDYILVSSLNDSSDSLNYTGSAYFFEREGDEWNEINKVGPTDGDSFDEFGRSLSLRDNLAIIGSSKHDENGTESGAAYIYSNQDTAWVLQEKIVASDASVGAEFGFSVSISDSIATIGAHHDIYNEVDTTGAVYVYRKSIDGWQEEQKIITPETTFNMEFGRTNDHYGDRLVIGTVKANTVGVAQCGATFLYNYNGTSWEYERKITANDAGNGDQYAGSISLEQDFLIVGAFGEDANGGNAGAAYVHYLECEPVCTTISSPIDGGVSVPLDTDISWYAVDDALGYLLSVGTSPGAVDVLDNEDVGSEISFDLVSDLAVDTEYFINISAYSDAGNSSGCIESSFTTEAVPMILNVGANVTIPCYEPVPNATYIVNNICAEATVTITNDTILGDCEAEYTIVRTYTATDGCTTLTSTQTIIVDDADGPEILTVPEDVVIGCGDPLPTDLPTGIDECNSGDVTVTYVDSPDPMCGVVVERVFSVADACGNITLVSQLITIEASDGLPSCSFLDSPTGENNPVDVSLVWTEATDVTGYVLSIGTSTGATDVIDNLDVENILTYDLTSLDIGTTYYVTITPYNEIGSAVFCNEFEFTTGNVPSCVDLVPFEDDLVYPIDVILQWTESLDAAGYFLTVGTTVGGNDILDNVDVMEVLLYEFATLPAGSMIYVNITPYNEFGNALECSEMSFETDVPEGLEELYVLNNVSVYPNPNIGNSITISFDDDARYFDVEQILLIDALGQVAERFTYVKRNQSIYNLSFQNELSSGIYTITLISSKGSIRKSFVVE